MPNDVGRWCHVMIHLPGKTRGLRLVEPVDLFATRDNHTNETTVILHSSIPLDSSIPRAYWLDEHELHSRALCSA